MKLDNINDMVADYEQKTGETVDLSGFKWQDKIGYVDKQNMHLKIVPHGGFFIWATGELDGEKYLYLDQHYGEFKSVVSYLKEVISINSLTSIVTATHRNIKPFMRKWKMRRLEKYDYDFEGRHYYVLQTDVNNLRG